MPHSILWRRTDSPGHEVGRLVKRDDHWELSGAAVFSHDRDHCWLQYLVVCDPAWHTRSARVHGQVGDREVQLSVTVDQGQCWFLNGAECTAVKGCIDIDLGFSPSTNLLPIRRLALGVGSEANVRAAWLPFPSLAFEVLPQLYLRDEERTYHYASRNGAFVRKLKVNDSGFVTSYPGFWEAEGDGALSGS